MFPAAGPVLACCAVRAWGCHARQRTGWAWFVVGLLLATLAADAVARLHTLLYESPRHRLTWPLLGAVSLLVLWVARREWRALGPDA